MNEMEAAAHGFQATYVIPVLLGVALAALFPASRTFENARERHVYRIVQLCTLIGALVGAKLTAVVVDLRWPLSPLPDDFLFRTGRTLTGGLLFGFLTAELLKPLLGHRHPPNDRFAMILPFSIAIGRVGCLLSGCCNGQPWEGPWAIEDADGVPRHPTALYDLLFHLALGAVLVGLFRAGRVRHRLFALHLIAYGVFRFAIETIRTTPEYALGLTGYQIVSLLLIAAGATSWARTALTAEPASARIAA
jgi:phosphatidylglycerol:prolipoprotein diacylglycerol transferase